MPFGDLNFRQKPRNNLSNVLKYNKCPEKHVVGGGVGKSIADMIEIFSACKILFHLLVYLILQ